MSQIRLLPVVILAVAALLVLKTIGLVTHGGYVLTGVSVARASEGAGAASGGETAEGEAGLTLPEQPTLEDASPTIEDPSPTMSGEAAAADHGGAPAGEEAVESVGAAPPATSSTYCVDADANLVDEVLAEVEQAAAAEGESDAAPEGEYAGAEATPEAAGAFAASMSIDCLPSGDAVPMQLGPNGSFEPVIAPDGSSNTEQQILERLSTRRGDLEKYEQDLALRSSLVDAAEKRIEERQTTLEALEKQISTLVDQRKEMESGQFAGIVAMYEAMKPKDAANIFNNLDMEVLLRVAKTMQPRKMAPILAEMDPARAQELTVKMADLADQPAEQMTPDDLSALPQIVGQ